jgi:hypothetical protein
MARASAESVGSASASQLGVRSTPASFGATQQNSARDRTFANFRENGRTG